MSLREEQKRCPICGTWYSWNLDVGIGLLCPHCKGGLWPKSQKEKGGDAVKNAIDELIPGFAKLFNK